MIVARAIAMENEAIPARKEKGIIIIMIKCPSRPEAKDRLAKYTSRYFLTFQV